MPKTRNLERLARRKQQTRLRFDPLQTSSSPCTMTPARVGYHPAKPLPTPANSSQVPANDDSLLENLDDSEDELSVTQPESHQTRKSSIFAASLGSSKKNKKHGRQASGLDGGYSSSDGESPEEDIYTPSKTKANRTPSKSKRIPKALTTVLDSQDESDLALPKRSTRQAKQGSKTYITLSDDSDDEISMSNLRSSQRNTSSSRKGKATQSSQTLVSSSKSRHKPIASSEEDEEEDDVRPSQPQRSSRLAIAILDDKDEDQEVVTTTPKKRTPRRVVDSDEEIVQRPSPQKRRPQQSAMSKGKSEPVISPLKRSRRTVDSSDSDIKTSPTKRQRNVQQDHSSSDSDLPSLRKIAAKARRNSTHSNPTSNTPRFTRQQRSPRKHRSEKEKAAELLRRRREGEKIDQVTDSESSSEGEDEEDEEFQILEEFPDEDSSPDQPRRSNTTRTRRNMDSEEDNDGNNTDTFVIEDEEGPLGIPDALRQIPLEFTHAAHKQIKEHFKDVIEWMIHNKVNPGFARNDPVYETAFQKVDDECRGFADSKFVSTQWTLEFTKALRARPNILLRKLESGEGVDALGEAKCEACNHRKHHPSWSIGFGGKAYDKKSLEDLERDSDDESNDSDSESQEHRSLDGNGNSLLPEDTRWFAGSVCKLNAELAHMLLHWKWHLNDWVVSRLEDEGLCSPEWLVKRDKMKAKARTAHANEIVDRWDDEGQIKTLYKDFKSQKDTARELKEKRRGGWQ